METATAKSLVLELPQWPGHRAGQHVDLRLTTEDPSGGYFVWEASLGGPLLLVAGGSGMIYREQLDDLGRSDATWAVHYTLTRSQPPNWTGDRRRIDRELLREIAWPPERHPLDYVCGPTTLVESVAAEVVGLGQDAARVKTERFGPTGD